MDEGLQASISRSSLSFCVTGRVILLHGRSSYTEGLVLGMIFAAQIIARIQIGFYVAFLIGVLSLGEGGGVHSIEKQTDN